MGRKRKPISRTRSRDLLIQANAKPSGTFTIQGASEGFELLAASGDGGSTLKRFAITAYTGVAMDLGFGYPVVVDLEGMRPPSATGPIFRSHDSRQIVGHWDKIDVSAQRIKLAGLISGTGDAANEVLSLAANGFPWQASIGASAQRMEFIDRGETVKVNGRSFTGPVYVARATTLGEVSFVPLGADSATSAVVAQTGGSGMGFEQWLRANGFDPSTLPEGQKAILLAAFNAQNKPAPTPAPEPGPVPTPAPRIDATAEIQALRAAHAAESTRVSQIRQLCAGNPLTISVGEGANARSVNLEAHAIAEGWDVQRTELAILRASRPSIPGGLVYATNAPAVSDAVLEAAVLQAGRCDLESSSFWVDEKGKRRVPERVERDVRADFKARYSDQVMQAAHTLFRGRIGLKQVLVAAARSNGYTGTENPRDGLDLGAVLRAQNWQLSASGASTTSLANVLANVTNKFLLMGYMFTEQSWRKIAGVRPVNDFKATKAISLLSDAAFLPVGPDGEIKSGSLRDQAFANQASTSARLLTITRQQMINDDLSAMTEAPKHLGRGAGLRLNKALWTTWLAPGNADDGNAFWTNSTNTHGTAPEGQKTAYANLSTGGGSALSDSALQTVTTQFKKQVDPMGEPLGIDPKVLLYPPELSSTALTLMNSQYTVGGSTRSPMNNNWFGRYDPVESAYLSNDQYSGYSATAWYLLADPAVMAAIEVCFLNGQEAPTIESADADFATLGIQIRGYLDFGVTMQNFRAGQKAAGA